jgi:antitoxin ParD1/3/4
VGKRSEEFVAEVVSSGRYRSPGDVVCEGLRLVEEREVKLTALRDAIDVADARGSERTDQQVGERLAKEYEKAKTQGL